MSGVPVVLLFTWCVMFTGEIQPSSALDKCLANANCRNVQGRKVCCAKSTKRLNGCVMSSCLGEPCSSDADCGGKGECCKSNQCTTTGCNGCNSNSDCGSYPHNLYCCQDWFSSYENVCRHNCIGETCFSDSDCGGPGEYCTSSKKCWTSGLSCREDSQCKGDGECCKYGKCVTQCTRSCSDDCKFGECCKYGVCSTSCDGDHCSSNSDCRGSSDKCCKRGNLTSVCRDGCVGENCLSDDHCGGHDEYCNTNTTKCEKKDNSLAGWAIAVIVISVLVFAFFFGGGWVYCRCFAASSPRRRVVREEVPQRTTAIIALRETEIRTISSPPAPNYPPPAYYNQGQDRVDSSAMPSLPPQQGYPPQQYPPQQAYPPQPLHFPSPYPWTMTYYVNITYTFRFC